MECVSKERRVVFILSDEIHRYIEYVAGVYVFLEREGTIHSHRYMFFDV